MSILTKIAIVVIALLSITASVLFINMTTVIPNYRDGLSAEKLRSKKLEDENQRLVIAKNFISHARALERVRDSGRVSTEQRNMETIRQLSEAKDAARQLSTALDQANARDKESRSLLTSEIARRQAQGISLEKVLASKDELASRVRGLEETTKDAEAKAARVQTTVDSYKGRIYELEDRNRKLIVKLEAGGTSPEIDGEHTNAPASDVKIIASLTGVRDGVASVDAGSTKGVVEGMKFYIYRGKELVGYLKITNVTASESAGIVTRQLLDPQVGDQVSNNLE